MQIQSRRMLRFDDCFICRGAVNTSPRPSLQSEKERHMTGRPIPKEHPDNEIRRRYGLPELSQLVFYEDPEREESRTDILEWNIEEVKKCYSILSVKTKNRTWRVHEGIVAFMQNPYFIHENSL